MLFAIDNDRDTNMDRHSSDAVVSSTRTDYYRWNMKHSRSSSSSSSSKKNNGISNWLLWMISGKRRGVGEIKMREAAELGGLPRPDRYSARDFLHNTITLPNSAILRDIRFPVICLTSWATFVSILHGWLLRVGRVGIAEKMRIPTQPHSLMVSALGLLLVFRTNSAYQRFVEGRKIWEEMVNTSRDFSRVCKVFEENIGIERRRRLQRLMAAFPYFLRHRIRPNLVKMHKLRQGDRLADYSLLLYMDAAGYDTDAQAAAVAEDEEGPTGRSRRPTRPLYWVDTRTLPWRLLPKGEQMEACAQAQNRPLWVCDRMAAEIANIPLDHSNNYTPRERVLLLGYVEKLSRTIGACERIHQTVVPLNYARHALRSLTLWLLSLPFCLVKDVGMYTGPVLFFMSWMLFGVYEIGYNIEDPFQGTLRLSILCDTIRRDVLADEMIRNTAFLQMAGDFPEPRRNEIKTTREYLNGLRIYTNGNSSIFD